MCQSDLVTLQCSNKYAQFTKQFSSLGLLADMLLQSSAIDKLSSVTKKKSIRLGTCCAPSHCVWLIKLTVATCDTGLQIVLTMRLKAMPQIFCLLSASADLYSHWASIYQVLFLAN